MLKIDTARRQVSARVINWLNILRNRSEILGVDLEHGAIKRGIHELR